MAETTHGVQGLKHLLSGRLQNKVCCPCRRKKRRLEKGATVRQQFRGCTAGRPGVQH